MGRKRSDQSLTKKEAVRLALEQGITSPTAIAEHLRQTQGIAITPEHVSTIKGGLKRDKEKGGRKGKPGRKPRQQPAGEQATPSAARTSPAQRGSGLTPGDLKALADVAQRAGGVRQLQAFLAALQRLR
jgi:hypothetical protein